MFNICCAIRGNNVQEKHWSSYNCISFLYSRKWEVSDKAELSPRYTCHDEQPDGSCGSVQVPSCEDRTVTCSTIPNPNSVQTNNAESDCSDCPAKLITVGQPPNPNDFRVLDTELQ